MLQVAWAQPARPNILLVLADDLGFTDIAEAHQLLNEKTEELEKPDA